MKRLFPALALFAALIFAAQAATAAKKPKDQEFRHIAITLCSGEVVDGYLHRNWSAETSYYALKKANYSLKIVPTPESDEVTKYTADEIDHLVFLEATENEPDGQRWDACPVARPSISNRYHSARQLVCLSKRGDNATIYWWNEVVTGGHRGQQRILTTIYGIRFDGDEVVYPFGLLVPALMKKNYPGLAESLKEFRKEKAQGEGATQGIGGRSHRDARRLRPMARPAGAIARSAACTTPRAAKDCSPRRFSMNGGYRFSRRAFGALQPSGRSFLPACGPCRRSCGVCDCAQRMNCSVERIDFIASASFILAARACSRSASSACSRSSVAS